jgi:homoserine kinase
VTLHPLRHHAVKVPATSANLGAGYDAFGIALDLHLAVRSLPRDAQTDRVSSEGECGEVASDDGNLIWRAVVALCEHEGLPVPDVALHTASRIPLERGLGSSSSAIVAGLVLGRALTGAGIGDRDLVDLAAELEGHPDNVAPALLGGLVVCSRADDGAVVTRRVNPTPRLRPILCIPAERQVTADARAVLPDHLGIDDVALQASRAGHVLGALTGLWPADARLSGDRLHEPARASVMRPSAALLADLREAGVHAWLSGAGPSVAGAVSTAEPDGAEERCRAIAARHGFALHGLRFDLAGALACPDDGCAISGAGRCAPCPREGLS